MGKKILVPIDLSPNSARVLEQSELILQEGDQLILLHVVLDPSEYAGFHIPHLSTEIAREELLEGAKKHMEKFVALHAPGTPFLLKFGVPFREILKTALEEDAAAIVIGSHQSSSGRLERLLISHAFEKVVRQAHCPVLVVPVPIETEEEVYLRQRVL